MSEEIVGYLCEGCGSSVDIPTWKKGKFGCMCEMDENFSWRAMTERDFYWGHNGNGFDCDCDDCEKFREESK